MWRSSSRRSSQSYCRWPQDEEDTRHRFTLSLQLTGWWSGDADASVAQLKLTLKSSCRSFCEAIDPELQNWGSGASAGVGAFDFDPAFRNLIGSAADSNSFTPLLLSRHSASGMPAPCTWSAAAVKALNQRLRHIGTSHIQHTSTHRQSYSHVVPLILLCALFCRRLLSMNPVTSAIRLPFADPKVRMGSIGDEGSPESGEKVEPESPHLCQKAISARGMQQTDLQTRLWSKRVVQGGWQRP